MGILLSGFIWIALQGQESDLSSLIQELQSDDLSRRNAATAKLEKLGPTSLPRLTEAREKTRDPEVRSRLEKVIGEIEVEHTRPRRIVFTRGQESEAELYLWENGETRRLTENKKIEARPKLSPDGARLAYFTMADIEEWKQADVVVMTLADRSIVRIGTGSEPVWSPDGARIAWHQDQAIHVASADGKNDKIVFRSSGSVRGVTWSGDGKMMAVEQDENIWIVDPADGKSRRVIETLPDAPTLAQWSWSPDGKTFGLVAGNGPYLWNVYTVAADGSGLAMRTQKGWVGHGIVQWAPDSRRLAACVTLGSGLGPGEPEVGGLDTGLHILDSTSGVIRRVAKDVNSGLLPQWSPDGKFIVYVTGKQEIWISHVPTGAGRKVTQMGIPDGPSGMWYPPAVHWPSK